MIFNALVLDEKPTKNRNRFLISNESITNLSEDLEVPLLDTHSASSIYNKIGRAFNFKIENNKLFADIEIQNSDILERIKKNVISKVSLGGAGFGKLNEKNEIMFKKWEITEISLVIFPAVEAAGILSKNKEVKNMKNNIEKIDLNETGAESQSQTVYDNKDSHFIRFSNELSLENEIKEKDKNGNEKKEIPLKNSSNIENKDKEKRAPYRKPNVFTEEIDQSVSFSEMNNQKNDFMLNIREAKENKTQYIEKVPISLAKSYTDLPPLYGKEEQPIYIHDDIFNPVELLTILKAPANMPSIQKSVIFGGAKTIRKHNIGQKADKNTSLSEKIIILNENYGYRESFPLLDFDYYDRVFNIREEIKQKFSTDISLTIQEFIKEKLESLTEATKPMEKGFIKKKVKITSPSEVRDACNYLVSIISSGRYVFLAGHEAHSKMYSLPSFEGAATSAVQSDMLFGRYPVYHLPSLNPKSLFFLNPKSIFYLGLFGDPEIEFDFLLGRPERIVNVNCNIGMGLASIEKTSSFIAKIEY